MAYIFKNETFPQFKFAYYWPLIWFLLVLSRKSKANGCSLTCFQPQRFIFCFVKFCTDHALSVGMPTFFCGVLTTKWSVFFFLLSFCNKTSLSSVLKENDWTVWIKNSRILNFLYLFNTDIICHQLRVLLAKLLSWSNVSMLPKPSRSSFFSASIHKQSPIPFLMSRNTMVPPVNIFAWLCEMNLCNKWSKEPPSKHIKCGAVHQGGHDLQQTLHLTLHMLLCAILPLDESLYFIRPTFSISPFSQQITRLPRCLCTYTKKAYFIFCSQKNIHCNLF